MTSSSPRIRDAGVDDAAILAELVDMAGKGMPAHLWARMAASGETPLDIGRRRAMRDTGSFSWRNAVVAERDGRVVACVVGYQLPDPPRPIDRDSTPAMLVPFQELENLAPGTWYVNFLATLPAFRNQGIGTRLLIEAEARAMAKGIGRLSIIVFDTNASARRLYERRDFRFVATRPIVKEDWNGLGENLHLLMKNADAG
ncbi:MAG: GNAT family N-acetyltransferase [Alphaproteobacteria bacterium]